MTPEQLKELESLSERWKDANDRKKWDIVLGVIDLLPDVLENIKHLERGIDGMHQSVASMELTRKGAEAERDAAQKAYAEMRAILAGVLVAVDRENVYQTYDDLIVLRENINHAIATDCGKGYHADSEWRPVVEALRSGFELIDNAGPRAFENGVKDSTGSIDEGEVVAGRIYEAMEQALAHAERLTGKAKE